MSLAVEIAVEYRENGMEIGPLFDRLVPVFGMQRSLEAVIATIGLNRERERELLRWLQEEPGTSQMPNIDALMQADLEDDEDDEDVSDVLELSFDEQQVPDRPANVTLPMVTSETRPGKCVICLSDTLTSPVELTCGHSFCHECIKTWFSTRDSCPCCRQISKPVRAPTKRRRRVQRPPRAGRRRPRCRRCGALRAGHSRAVCTTVAV